MLNNYDESYWKRIDDLVHHTQWVIDRPKGSAHPRYPDFIYPVDYGYLAGTSSMDGGGIDIWVGSVTPARVDGIMCIIDSVKKDAEIKVLLGCSDIEIVHIYEVLNTGGMQAIYIKKIGRAHV